MTVYCKKLAESTGFQVFFTGIIVFAGVVVGLQTYPSIVFKYGHSFDILDKFILWLFVLEIVIRMTALGRNFFSFFKDGWNY